VTLIEFRKKLIEERIEDIRSQQLTNIREGNTQKKAYFLAGRLTMLEEIIEEIEGQIEKESVKEQP